MGNCGNKPLTAEGDAPAPEEKAVESTERELVLETKVITTDVVDDHDQITPRSLAQMLEDEEKKPEAVEVAKPAEETAKAEPSETKPAEVAEVKAEEKIVEVPAKAEEKA